MGKRAVARLRAGMRNSACMAATLALLSCFAVDAATATEPTTLPSGSTIQRSTRVVPRKYVIFPTSTTIAANQTQHFGVVDSDGRPVAVRWNVSGLGCYGASCGSIDADGMYRPPASLPKPRVVTLEGVVIADPHYSVLTQIKLEDAAAAAPAVTQQPQEQSQSVAGQSVAGQSAVPQAVAGQSAAVQSVPSQSVAAQPLAVQPDTAQRSQQQPAAPVQSAPTVAAAVAPPASETNVARVTKSMPVPAAVPSSPAIATQNISSRGGTMPVPAAVGSTPALNTVTIARANDSMPLPSVVGAPAIVEHEVSRHAELPPLPSAVAAAPVVGKPDNGRSAALPLPAVVSATPTVGKQDISSRVESVPTPRPVSAAPKTSALESPRTLELIPTPTAVVVTRVVPKQETAHAEPMPVPKAMSPAPANPTAVTQHPLEPMPIALPEQGSSTQAATLPANQPPLAKVQSLLLAKNQIPAGMTPLTQLPGAGAAAAAGTTPQGSLQVTYLDGQLAIDARNTSLAQVLKLVAEKIGATIDVPPGSGLEPVFEHAGPGRPNDVLTSLLNGSHFNFIIVNSPQNPNAVAQVLLSVEQESPAPADVQPKTTQEVASKKAPEPQTPPEPQARVDVKLPTGELSPEERGDFMKNLFKEAGERIRQEEATKPPQ